MSGHPKHPKCPNCGRAMYKSPESRAVKKSEPFAFCRNKKCKLHLTDQSKMSDGELVEAMGKPLDNREPEPGDGVVATAKAAHKRAAEQEAAEKAAKAKAEAEKGKGKKGAKKTPTNKPKKPSKEEKAKAAKDKKAADKKAEDERKRVAKKDKAEAKAKKASDKKAAAAAKKSAKGKPAAEPPVESETQASGDEGGDGDGRSAEYKKAATRIKNALDEDGPFTKKICELAVSMVVNKDSEDAARDLIAEFGLTDKYGLKLP